MSTSTMTKPTLHVSAADQAALAYPADLYRFDKVAEDGVDGFAAVDGAAVERFHRDGYLVIHGAFTGQEVAGALQEMLELLAHPQPAFSGIHFESSAPREKLAEMAPELRQDYVRKFFNFVAFAPHMKALSEHPELLDVVSRVIGAQPVLFQDMALLKPPRIGREVGSRTGAPTVGSGGNSNRFRVGPQSGSPGHVSSPRLVKRSMRISRTTLSCLLRVKGYVAVRVGSAFRAAHSSRFLLHLFHPCPPVFPPGSAFAFTYILCLRSRSSIGAFIISPLPPCFQSRYRQQGRFPPPALPGFTGTTNPSATLSPVSRLPGAPGYTAYLAPPISRRGEEGFSSCLARPRYRAVATTPPECRSALASLRYAMLLSSRTWGLSLRVFCFSRPPVRSLSLRPGNSPATPYGGRVNGLQVIVFSPPCHPCYGALALTPAGLSPAERASLCWTHKPWHQDHAYFNLPLDTPVLGVWIALDRATTANGCMTVIPGSHRRGPVVHFQRRDWQICDSHVDNRGALAVPLEPGGCLLFSSLMQHGTPTNTASERRRALQFHYAPVAAVRISTEQRMAVFGAEGKSVTC